MGFLSGISNAISSVVNTITAPIKAVATAVAGPAMDMLKNIVGSGFDGIKNIASTLASPFPGLSGLLKNFGFPGLDAFKNLGLGGLGQLQQFLQSITGQPQPTTVPDPSGNVNGGSTVVRPPAPQAAQTYAAAAGPSGTLQSAATSALNNSPGSVSALMSQIGNSSSLSPMQDKMIKQLQSDPNADPKQIAMMQLQFQMENMKQLMEMISNISKTLSGISSTITGNMRA